MLQFYGQLLGDLSRLELASGFLRQLARATEQTTSPEYFSLLTQALAGLNHAYPTDLVQIWFQLNLARISGEEINLICDANGAPLALSSPIAGTPPAAVLRPNPAGPSPPAKSSSPASCSLAPSPTPPKSPSLTAPSPPCSPSPAPSASPHLPGAPRHFVV